MVAIRSSRFLLAVLACSCIFILPFVSAQSAAPVPGSLDPGFGSGGPLVFDYNGNDNEAYSLQVLDNDKILVYGMTFYPNGNLVRGSTLVVNDADGQYDTGFGDNGILIPDVEINGYALQADGKILVTATNLVERYLRSGGLDPDFGSAGKVTPPFDPLSIALQPDGKIILAGLTYEDAWNGLLLTRLLPDGSVDPTFGSGGQVSTTSLWTVASTWIAVQPDGKIVRSVYGYSPLDYSNQYELLRYTAGGSLDSSFGSAGRASALTGGPIKFQSDGKILLVGPTLARYTTNGSLDPGFHAGSPIPLDNPRSCWLQADGKIVVALGSGVINRYTSAGSLDSGGALTLDRNIGSAGVLSNGKIVSVRTISSYLYDYELSLFNPDGALDTTFNARAGYSAYFGAIQPDGKIVAGSSTTIYRYKSDGSPDTTFGSNGAVNISGVGSLEAIALQPDGKIVAVGTLVNNDSSADMSVARVTASGQLDTTFSGDGKLLINVQLHDRAHAVAVTPDGKILVAGETDTGNLDWKFLVMRLNSIGAPDTTFGGTSGGVLTGFASAAGAHAVIAQPDGMVLAAGLAGSSFATVRYKTDGHLDTSFGNNGAALTAFGSSATARAIVLQADGKILVGGPAGSLYALARYTTSGAPDTSFGSGGQVTTSFGGYTANSLALLPDGKIVLAGGGNGRLGIAQYTLEGSLDPDFSEDGKVCAGSITGKWVAVQPDGKLVAGGDNGLVRLYSTYTAKLLYIPIVIRNP